MEGRGKRLYYFFFFFFFNKQTSYKSTHVEYIILKEEKIVITGGGGGGGCERMVFYPVSWIENNQIIHVLLSHMLSVITISCCEAKHCWNTQRFISSFFPKDSGYTRLKFGEMYNISICYSNKVESINPLFCKSINSLCQNASNFYVVRISCCTV